MHKEEVDKTKHKIMHSKKVFHFWQLLIMVTLMFMASTAPAITLVDSLFIEMKHL